MTSDPKVLGLAFLGGTVPALFWLWFWLKEEEKKKEPKGLLTVVFILGMIAVVLVIPIQKYIQSHVPSHEFQIIGWAAAEEILKYLAMLIILYKTTYVDEPLDWPIYCITAALGFAALENTFFLIKPLSEGQAIVGLITGQLRFLGSTLLHAISSGIVGISMGLSFFLHKSARNIYIAFGILLAIALHSVFNFFIMKNNGSDFLKVFAFLWVATIIIMLLFEKIRRMSGE